MMVALIMAGGAGTRFWPKSRDHHPKQLLQIIGSGTMLQSTVRRLQPIIPPDRVFIVCKQSHREAVAGQLPELPRENIIIEPQGKNTAPWLNAAKIAAEEKVLITIGIKPSFPATGYGYIQFSQETVSAGQASAWRVKTFAEKPNLETAKVFLASGDFLWNSGIFVWRISTIREQFEEHLPQVHDGLLEISRHLGTPEEQDIIVRVYQQIKSISIDYGVMEKAKNVLVVLSNFEWNDLGSWDEVYKLSPKDKEQNALCDGDHALVNTSGCLIDVAGKTVAAVGIRDLIVVETEDALLLCPREHAQDVKEVVELLKRKKKMNLL
ncbi:mannose-1-phosphate guanylyltransferase [candidate division KSB1 bacterium]|nr:mannose-1-phosphate guanylyltransferase [candidate division KSB1 bacterium]